MTINLNNTKQVVSKEGLLEYISEVDVYNYYTGKPVSVGVNILSPLREEQRPSFAYYIKDGDILFKDFVLGGGDFINFVQLKFGLSYFEALSKIAIDLELEDRFIVKPMPKTINPVNIKPQNKEEVIGNKSPILIEKRSREWKSYDLAYWLQYGITLKVLEKYYVQPIDYLFINGFPIKTEKFAYCFIENKDNKETYKIYQPFSKEFKWRSNHNDSIWQGWQQLPDRGKTLIITKSLKDVMSIVNTTSYASVSLQAESVKPKDHIIDELKNRFDDIYLLYDNDFDKEINWGQRFAIDIIQKYNISNVVLPTHHECKDYSDLYKKYGSKASEILNESILNALPF